MGKETGQEKVEQVLKEIHVLFSRCDYYDDDKNMIIVDKRELFRLLEHINLYMYEMMDAYEVTAESRARAERKSIERGDAIIADATQKADDIYAAAMSYTDEALAELRQRLMGMMRQVDSLYDGICNEMEDTDKVIQKNRSELREQLEEMKEGDKYLSIIDEENKKRMEALAAEDDLPDEFDENGKRIPRSRRPIFDRTELERNRYDDPIKIVAPTPEIKINPAYEENTVMDSFDDGPVSAGGPQISVNLDAEYFKWKNGGELPDVEEGVIDDADFVEGVLDDTTESAGDQSAESVKKTAGRLMGTLFGKK